MSDFAEALAAIVQQYRQALERIRDAKPEDTTVVSLKAIARETLERGSVGVAGAGVEPAASRA